ncbi:MAG: hypothetical protein AMS15_08325 [Planctomycetes bacterium DG_23]|nr:MAG: hypothetical protein AMS15_08325 [Planctomycetes bacterium DG_23]
MTSKERVQATFEGRQVDKVPVHHLGFSSKVASALLKREAFVGGGIQKWREAQALWQGEDAHQAYVERSYRDAIDIALFCGHDIIRPTFWRHNVKPSKRIDEYTFLYAQGAEDNWRVLRYDPESEECHIFDYIPRPERTFEDLKKEIEAQEAQIQDYKPKEEDFEIELRAQQQLGAAFVIRVGGVGIGLPLSEMEPWLEAVAACPDLVGRLLDIQAERAVRNIEFLAARGFRYFFGGRDFASNQGPMYSPGIFRELILPRLRRVSEACHRSGAYHLFASDGNLWKVADDLFDHSGIDGYYEIDRRAGMDLRRLRERFPGLTLIGNISSHTVHMGTKEEVIAEARSALEEARRSGRIIVGVSNFLVPDTPVENVTSLLETIREYR